jgi:peptidase E
MHCGECSEIPCKKLWQYSYTDPAHGDTPPGARVEQCRKWAADSGLQKWENVLLTDSAFGDWDGGLFAPLVDRFAKMLGKPFAEAKVLFIPSAEKNWQTAEHVEWCKKELLKMGILPNNITVCDLTYRMPESKAMAYDVLYFTGGSAARLLKMLTKTGFDKTVKKMVYANKVYIGVSAGSLIAMPHLNIDAPPDAEETPGLCLVHAYFTVHCEPNTPNRTDLRLPHYAIGEGQAIAVNWAGFELIDGTV